jgi:D-alanyl-lipoteichoic acid acyltransferase DltB (MBOAT superfamily)
MLFNSLTFILFFPLVLIGYYLCPAKLRHYFLLAVSAVFYMWWNPYYIVLLYTSIALTYLCGLALGRTPGGEGGARKAKLVIAATLAVNIGILAVFKYANFGMRLIDRGFDLMGIDVSTPRFDILLPVGISFYTFQALAYIIDCYRGEIKPERNFAKYALFVSFFPQMVAGPIERSKNLLTQVRNSGRIKVGMFDDIAYGLTMLLWGFFMKTVISDRVAMLVNTVYDSWWNYGATEISAATVGFAFQIYCDFWGYSCIALGAARMMGFKLMVNFEQPYFAMSIREFWRRWHISLSTWFRDYLYIPLGGNRKGPWRKRLNLLIVFTVSGLWHGANVTFVVWGFLHGIYQVVGDITQKSREAVCERCRIKTDTFSFRLWKRLATFALVCFAWVFFRADSLYDALHIFKTALNNVNPWALFNGSLFELGIDRPHFNVLFLALVVLFVVDRIRYRKGSLLSDFLLTQNLVFRWIVLLALFAGCLLFGAYGPEYDAQQFIYFQF